MFQAVKKLLQVTALWVLVIPIVLYILGSASNQLVLFVNHGQFPVSLNIWRATADADVHGMLDPVHVVMTSKTHLNLLADIFDFHENIESAGDLLIELGGWLWGFAPFVWGFEVVRRLRS